MGLDEDRRDAGDARDAAALARDGAAMAGDLWAAIGEAAAHAADAGRPFPPLPSAPRGWPAPAVLAAAAAELGGDTLMTRAEACGNARRERETALLHATHADIHSAELVRWFALVGGFLLAFTALTSGTLLTVAGHDVLGMVLLAVVAPAGAAVLLWGSRPHPRGRTLAHVLRPAAPSYHR